MGHFILFYFLSLDNILSFLIGFQLACNDCIMNIKSKRKDNIAVKINMKDTYYGKYTVKKPMP